MEKGIKLSLTFTINRDIASVWQAIIDPEKVKQYFFGTQLYGEWEEGGKIRFTGEWEGKTYEDKGIVLQYEPEKILRYNYWSSFSTKPDIPENYAEITYTVHSENGATVLTITQDSIESEEQKEHSEQNWQGVIGQMKQMLEEGTI